MHTIHWMSYNSIFNAKQLAKPFFRSFLSRSNEILYGQL